MLRILKKRLKNILIRHYARRGIVLQSIGGRAADLDDYFESLYRRTYSKDALEQKRFYNIGAGRFRHRYWTNVDLRTGSLSSQWNADDIDFDISANQPLPLNDDHAELIYSSHVIEHVSNVSAASLLADCFRVLRPGGSIRIVCPDVDLATRAFELKDWAFFEQFYAEAIPSLAHGLARFIATESVVPDSPGYMEDKAICDLLAHEPEDKWRNLLTLRCSPAYQHNHPDNHINWFNGEKLVQMLQEAGFRTIYLSGYGQSAVSALRDIRYFDSTLPFMSVFVEARK